MRVERRDGNEPPPFPDSVGAADLVPPPTEGPAIQEGDSLEVRYTGMFVSAKGSFGKVRYSMSGSRLRSCSQLSTQGL